MPPATWNRPEVEIEPSGLEKRLEKKHRSDGTAIICNYVLGKTVSFFSCALFQIHLNSSQNLSVNAMKYHGTVCGIVMKQVTGIRHALRHALKDAVFFNSSSQLPGNCQERSPFQGGKVPVLIDLCDLGKF